MMTAANKKHLFVVFSLTVGFLLSVLAAFYFDSMNMACDKLDLDCRIPFAYATGGGIGLCYAFFMGLLIAREFRP